jgi:TonB-dependent receptor
MRNFSKPKPILRIAAVLCFCSAALHGQTGAVEGRVLDAENREPIGGATVLVLEQLEGDEIGDILAEGETGASGAYRIEKIPTGLHALRFIKADYRPSTLRDVEIEEGQTAAWDFPLPPLPEEAGEVFTLAEFVVSSDQVSDEEYSFEVFRKESLLSVDLLTGADFSRFAAGDVAEAIKRIPGVTVQEGQFAVIRGLNERYSSTVFNGAPVPSPDPDKQSIPLDLFPSDIVSNLVVSKTYSPEFPGNAAGGTLDIRTDLFPQEWTTSLSAGTQWNSEAEDRYVDAGERPRLGIDFDATFGEKAVLATEQLQNFPTLAPQAADVPQAYSFGLDFGGTTEFFNGRELGIRLNVSQSRKYTSLRGVEEDLFGSPGERNIIRPNAYLITSKGDFAAGELTISNGRYDVIESETDDETHALVSLETDLDQEGNHSLFFTTFYIEKTEKSASLRENGFIPTITEEADLGNAGNADWKEFSSLIGGFEVFKDTRLWKINFYDEDREFSVYQFSGDHAFGASLDGLSLHWMASMADTAQASYNAFTGQGFRMPDGTYKTGQTTDIPEVFAAYTSWRETDEEQEYLSGKAEYEIELSDTRTLTPFLGYQYEDTTRGIRQEVFQFTPKDIDNFLNDEEDGRTYPTISEALRNDLSSAGSPSSARTSGLRTVEGIFFGTEFSLVGMLDVSVGARLENLEMETGTNRGEEFFNSEILRLGLNDAPRRLASENAQILGYDGPLPSDFVGVIDEERILPVINLVYEFSDRLRLRAGYAKNLVRPSFKEFAFITSRNPVTLDWESGNPKLQPSDTESIDFRLEYLFPENRDLVAVSLFSKRVENPIERTTLEGTVQTKIFFNNPNEATIKGIELEAQKSLDFLDRDWARHLSIGGNFSYIYARVDVPENFKRLLSGGFFLEDGRVLGGAFYATPEFDEEAGETPFLPPQGRRPLFDQPEWIANLNLRFDQPDWGTAVTLSFFAQGRSLDSAAGYVGSNKFAVPDIYLDTFEEVNLVITQDLWKHFQLTLGIENLTNSKRTYFYDDEVIASAPIDREYRSGRIYMVSLKATF